MILKKIVYSQKEPEFKEVLWLKVINNKANLFCYNNGDWERIRAAYDDVILSVSENDFVEMIDNDLLKPNQYYKVIYPGYYNYVIASSENKFGILTSFTDHHECIGKLTSGGVSFSDLNIYDSNVKVEGTGNLEVALISKKSDIDWVTSSLQNYMDIDNSKTTISSHGGFSNFHLYNYNGTIKLEGDSGSSINIYNSEGDIHTLTPIDTEFTINNSKFSKLSNCYMGTLVIESSTLGNICILDQNNMDDCYLLIANSCITNINSLGVPNTISVYCPMVIKNSSIFFKKEDTALEIYSDSDTLQEVTIKGTFEGNNTIMIPTTPEVSIEIVGALDTDDSLDISSYTGYTDFYIISDNGLLDIYGRSNITQPYRKLN